MSAIYLSFLLSSFVTLNRGLRRAADTGVKRNTPLSTLLVNGCTICYDAEYGSETKSVDIASCSGPFLFVGARRHDGSVLEIGAIASAKIVQSESSRSNPSLSRGTYWHFSKGESFGFTAEQNDSNTSADVVQENSETSNICTESRLLWRLDQANGTANCHQRANITMWRKNIYNCPHLSCE